jgi:hypothetical protein
MVPASTLCMKATAMTSCEIPPISKIVSFVIGRSGGGAVTANPYDFAHTTFPSLTAAV